MQNFNADRVAQINVLNRIRGKLGLSRVCTMSFNALAEVDDELTARSNAEAKSSDIWGQISAAFGASRGATAAITVLLVVGCLV